ncbi:MAG: DUF6691 family protein [Nitrosomonadales bacterium]
MLKKMSNFFISGFIFSLGLNVAQVNNPETIFGFIKLQNPIQMDLLIVFGSAVLFSFLGFKYLTQIHHEAKSTLVNKKFILGSILFGAGWGISGLCPGTAISAIANLDLNLLVFILSMMVGILLTDYFFNKECS